MRITIALVVVLGLTASAQSLSFEVASVKANKPGTGGMIGPQAGGRFVMVNGTTRALLDMAFNLPLLEGPIPGAPAWIETERFDIQAKAADPQASFDQLRLMMQALLKGRFALAAHTEMRPRPVYSLVVLKPGALGPNLRPAAVDCDALRENIAAGMALPLTPPPPTGPVSPCTTRQRNDSLASSGMTMVVLARQLSSSAGRIVQDKTGLDGRFDFDLQFAGPVGAANQDPQRPSIFTTLQEQLGLKLEPGVAPIETLVVDRIERPAQD